MNGAQRPGWFGARIVSLGVLGILAAEGQAFAGAAETILGVGGRTIALGGAGTALADDATALFYNPGRLAECEDSDVVAGIHYVAYGLKVEEGDAPAARPTELKNTARPFAGACLQLPLDLAVGGMISFGTRQPFSLNHETPNDRPRFVLHGQPLETISFTAGAALKPVPAFSFGAAVLLNLDAQFAFDSMVPILTEEIGEATMRAQVGFSYGFVFGASLILSETIELGGAVRTASYVRFKGNAPIRANVAGVELLLPIVLDVTDGFSPFQVSFGANVRPLDNLRVVADVTWYQWSRFVQPFLDIRGEGDSALAREVQFEPLEPANFRNTIVPRLGGELSFLEDALHLRAGYAFRPTPAPIPTGKANLLDASTHLFSLGAGYAFDGEKKTDSESIEYTKSIDAFFRFTAMPQTEFEDAMEMGTRRIAFGGNTVEIGLSLGIGWR